MAHVHNVEQKFTENLHMKAIKSHLNEAWFNAPDGGELKEYFSKKVSQLPSEKDSTINAIIVPHAGYAYSLDTAISAYTKLDKSAYDRALILSPSHRYPFFEKVGIEPSKSIETSVGTISFDEDFNKALRIVHQIEQVEEASNAEHSLHIQLPLIRYFLGDIPVAGLMFGKWNYGKSLEDFAHDVYKILNAFDGGIARTLIIVSTDFTHYGKNYGYVPFDEDIREGLNSLDHTIFHAFASQDASLFEMVMHKTKATVCGAVPLKFLQTLIPDKATIKEIAYTTSGELMNDFTNSVSYLSATISVDWKKGFPVRLAERKEESRFTAEERQMIVDIAHAAVDFSVNHKAKPQINYDTVPPKFMEQGAVFVTLEKHGNLRGCIGDIVPQRPLVDSILMRSYSAALEDPRFPPVTPEELPLIDIEVSVLSPPVPVLSYNDIIIGKHGVILQKKMNSAVFLPQVPVEQGWTLEDTLNHLAVKAGLQKDDWKSECKFFVFVAEVLH